MKKVSQVKSVNPTKPASPFHLVHFFFFSSLLLHCFNGVSPFRNGVFLSLRTD